MKKYSARNPASRLRNARRIRATPDHEEMFNFIVQNSVRVGIDAGIARRFAKNFITEKLRSRETAEVR